MNNNLSSLSLMNGAKLELYNSLNLGEGNIILYGDSGMETFNNSSLIGSLNRHY